MNPKMLAAAAVAVALTGCANMRPGPPPPTPAQLMAADPTAICVKRLGEDPFVITNLSAKTGIGRPGAPTLEMLSDKSYANDAEKKALSAYSAARQQCIDSGANYRRQNLPSQVTLTMEQSGQNITFLLAKLYAGEITFGEYNTRRVQNGSEARSRLSEYDQQRHRQQQAEAEQRRVESNNALQNFNNQMLLQQQINNANRPRTTNCQRLGSQVNCTTY